MHFQTPAYFYTLYIDQSVGVLNIIKFRGSVKIFPSPHKAYGMLYTRTYKKIDKNYIRISNFRLDLRDLIKISESVILDILWFNASFTLTT